MKSKKENSDKKLKKKKQLQRQMISGCFVYTLQDNLQKLLLHLQI